jgi:hypothetical protein
MRDHIFRGEVTDVNSGRHTLSSFLAKHPGLTPANQDAATKIQVFRFRVNDVGKIKTVWDDRADAYTANDIKNMCVTAGQILIKKGQTKTDGRVGAVVMSPFGTTACITFVASSTCFPLGTSTSEPLGELCTESG